MQGISGKKQSQQATLFLRSRNTGLPSRKALYDHWQPLPTNISHFRCLLICFSRTCLASNGFTERNRRRHTGQQPETNSASRPIHEPLMCRWSNASQRQVNRRSNAEFVPLSVLMGLHLFVLPKMRPGQFFRIA